MAAYADDGEHEVLHRVRGYRECHPLVTRSVVELFATGINCDAELSISRIVGTIVLLVLALLWRRLLGLGLLRRSAIGAGATVRTTARI